LEYQYPAIGAPPQIVSVPTHFFKVVVVVQGSTTITQYACFVVANDESDKEKQKQPLQLEECLVSWTDLEAVTGLELFPTLVNDEWKRRADALLVPIGKNNNNHKKNAAVPLLLMSKGNNNGNNNSGSRTNKQYAAHLRHLCGNDNSCKNFYKDTP
jgi:hypothetical protein